MADARQRLADVTAAEAAAEAAGEVTPSAQSPFGGSGRGVTLAGATGQAHRLAAQQAMAAAQAAEDARRSTHEPTGGGDPGVTLRPGADLSSLGMSPAAVVPVDGPLQIEEDWLTAAPPEEGPS